MTNIGTALIEIKQKKSELVRLNSMIQNSFTYMDKNKPEISFKDAMKRIQDKTKEIRKLKIKVENTNHATYVDTPEGKMTIAEAIHLIGDMRSELSVLESLKKSFERSYFIDEKQDSKKKYQASQEEIFKMISDLEGKKARMDSFISARNWVVKIKE